MNCFGASPFRACFKPGHAERPTEPKNGVVKLSKKKHHTSAREVQGHPAAEAFKAGRLAISFSGGGFLLPYFIGVADQLIALGILRPGGATPLAGSSAGSLIAASLACGIPPSTLYTDFLVTVRDCRQHGSYRRLGQPVRRGLESTLPPDAAERCSGVVTVGISCLFPRPHTWRVSHFTSRDDLMSALLASCHIPRYLNGELTTTFRGKVVVDGGLTALMPVPAAPHDFLLKVCCFPRSHVTRLPVFNRRRELKHLALGITPDAFGPWPHSFRDLLAVALHPGTDDFLQALRAAGRSDAAHWAVSAGLAPKPGVDRAPPPPALQPEQVVLGAVAARDAAAASGSEEEGADVEEEGESSSGSDAVSPLAAAEVLAAASVVAAVGDVAEAAAAAAEAEGAENVELPAAVAVEVPGLAHVVVPLSNSAAVRTLSPSPDPTSPSPEPSTARSSSSATLPPLTPSSAWGVRPGDGGVSLAADGGEEEEEGSRVLAGDKDGWVRLGGGVQAAAGPVKRHGVRDAAGSPGGSGAGMEVA